jgi:hypothetical protein
MMRQNVNKNTTNVIDPRNEGNYVTYLDGKLALNSACFISLSGTFFRFTNCKNIEVITRSNALKQKVEIYLNIPTSPKGVDICVKVDALDKDGRSVLEENSEFHLWEQGRVMLAKMPYAAFLETHRFEFAFEYVTTQGLDHLENQMFQNGQLADMLSDKEIRNLMTELTKKG